MSGEIVISGVAFAKMLLHAARWTQTAVSGVLLAQTLTDEEKQQQQPVHIVDAVPLFHLQIGLAPMLDIALTQIEHRYKDGLEIAGYYQANENLRDVVPDFVAMRVVEKIAENNDGAYLIMIDNRKMCLNLESPPIIVSQLNSDGKWKTKDSASVHVTPGSLQVVSTLLEKKVQHDLHDFDTHLDDVSRDWGNRHINDLLESFSTAP